VLAGPDRDQTGETAPRLEIIVYQCTNTPYMRVKWRAATYGHAVRDYSDNRWPLGDRRRGHLDDAARQSAAEEAKDAIIDVRVEARNEILWPTRAKKGVDNGCCGLCLTLSYAIGG